MVSGVHPHSFHTTKFRALLKQKQRQLLRAAHDRPMERAVAVTINGRRHIPKFDHQFHSFQRLFGAPSALIRPHPNTGSN